MAEMEQNTAVVNCSRIPERQGMFMGIVMTIEMLVGLPANIVAFCIFCFCMGRWKPHTLFLFNLILADFLLLISVPFRIHYNFSGNDWVFGQTWCSINLFMLSVNRSASIVFLTAVALDRYIKVVYPHHWMGHTTLIQSRWIASLMWIIVITLRIPLLTMNLISKNGNLSFCRSFNNYPVIPPQMKEHYAVFILEFFLPWFALLFCSVQITCHLHKRQLYRLKWVRRAIRAIGVITLVFTLCFLPSILTGLGGLYLRTFQPENCEAYKKLTSLFEICIGFTYLNSALDPVIYSFSSSMFRDALKSLASRLGFVKKNVGADNNTDNK